MHEATRDKHEATDRAALRRQKNKTKEMLFRFRMRLIMESGSEGQVCGEEMGKEHVSKEDKASTPEDLSTKVVVVVQIMRSWV